MPIPSLAHVYAPRDGAVLFVVQRACDGWIALDLAGRTTDEARGPVGERFVVSRGGPAHADRFFALHDRIEEVAAGRALAVGAPRGARFAFGGDLVDLWRDARFLLAPRLRFFRGLTVLRAGDERLERGLAATAELVFDTPPALAPLEFERAFVAAEAQRARHAVLVRDAPVRDGVTRPCASAAARGPAPRRGRGLPAG